MRVKSVEFRSRYLAKLTKKVLKIQKQAISFKNKAKIKLISFFQQRDEALNEGVFGNLQSLSELVGQLKKYEITKDTLNKIKVNSKQTSKLSALNFQNYYVQREVMKLKARRSEKQEYQIDLHLKERAQKQIINEINFQKDQKIYNNNNLLIGNNQLYLSQKNVLNKLEKQQSIKSLKQKNIKFKQLSQSKSSFYNKRKFTDEYDVKVLDQLQYQNQQQQQIKLFQNQQHTQGSQFIEKIPIYFSQAKTRLLQNLILKNQISQFNKKFLCVAQQQIQNNQNQINFRNILKQETNSQILSCQFKHLLLKIPNEDFKLYQKNITKYFKNLNNQSQKQLNFYAKSLNAQQISTNQRKSQNKRNLQFVNRQSFFQIAFDDNYKEIQLPKFNSQKLIETNMKFKFQGLLKVQLNQILGGGICGSKQKSVAQNAVQKKEQKQKKMKQIIDEKEKLERDFQKNNEDEFKKEDLDIIFKDFNEQYNKYLNSDRVNEKIIETHVRFIIEDALYKFRDQIVQQDIRHKVIDMINLVINYFLIIRQSKSTQSIQSDIRSITEKLETLIVYCKENKERHPCLDLYQYFDILKTLNSQRLGLDEANKSAALQIISKVVQVAKFGAGFVSIAGAIQNLSNINLSEINAFINEIKLIVQKITSESVTEAVKIGLDAYSDYNSNNIANNMQALWLRKVQYLGDSFSQQDPIQEVIFYLEESPKIVNKDTQLFVFMQLNYLLSKQKIEDNFFKFSKIFEDKKKQELITQVSDILQVKEYSESIIDKLKTIANLIAQNNQFRYIKAQLLLYFAQILKPFNQKAFTDIMTNVVSNYLQEKQKSVKIVCKNNQIISDFIHNHLDKASVLNQTNNFKRQMTKFLENKQQYNDFAYDIQNESDLDKQLAKYYIEIWEQSVYQRQKQLELAHKDDILLEAIHLYVNQQISYQEGCRIQTIEKDAIKQIIDQFLIPNFVSPSDDSQIQQENQQNLEKSNQNPCKIISILAEGGSGKSMLLKKLEVELLNRNSKYTADNRSDFIPFIIKCNSLDRENPSLEEYLEQVKIKRKDIEMLKKSERNKLIMLDGYDEYTGDYFKVYQKLKLYEWVNTLVIVTSRLEKITISDAKKYFNYYDNQGKQGKTNQFGIFKLEKITQEDIKDYLEKYKKQSENSKHFSIIQHDQIKEIIFKNKQLTKLLMLPINLYLTTRMITDIDLSDQKISKALQQVSDQVEIQELFFSQQFKKQSQIFIEEYQQLNLNDNQKQELMKKVESCYFEYFQQIAIKMFVQKGQKSNYLSITRDSIQFQVREEVSVFLKKIKVKLEDDLIEKIQKYVDSRVITRIQLKIDTEKISQNNKQKHENENKQQEFEFRHKSLFEYFAARAMKYDFDLHQENIFKLDLSQLKQFNINKRIIMSNLKNASEQQILLKLYKLMQNDIHSSYFMKTYIEEDITKTNKYMQFIKKSSISNYTEKSQIDIGASNLLSVLFLSKFTFPHLILKKCSFSQAYISSTIPKLVEFKQCNLSHSFIHKQNLENYETSNTFKAAFNNFQKQFDTDDIYSFKQVIFYKETLVSITQTGYLNKFEVSINPNESCKKLLSKQITNAPLRSIHVINAKNIFIISTNRSLFEVNAETFEIINTFTFNFPITTLSVNNSKYIVFLDSKQIFYGDIQNGLFLLDKIQGEQSLSINNYIITSQNQEINIYDLQTQQIIKNIKDCPLNLKISSITSDGKFLASCFDKTCKIFNIENGFQLIKTIREHNQVISSVAFSTDGKYLVTGSNENAFKIWKVDNEFELMNKIEGHNIPISSVAFSFNNKYFATSSEDKTCRIWNVENGFQLMNTIQGHTKDISLVAFSPDRKYLASSSHDTTCKIWSVENGFELIHSIQKHTDVISSVAFSSNGKYLATGSYDKSCKIWNLENNFELMYDIQEHTKRITSIAFSADNKYLATGSEDSTCNIYYLENQFELIITVEGHSNPINQVIFSGDSQFLATASSDNSCKIWNTENSFDHMKTIEGPISSIAFSADNRYLATGFLDKSCRIWNIENGFELVIKIEGHTENIYSIAFSPDGNYLATGSYDKTCKIWNVENGFQLISSIEGHTSKISSVTFSADSKYLATGSHDNTCKIWNVSNGFELLNRQIEQHVNQITSVYFCELGKYLATGSRDNTCKIWSVKNGLEFLNTIEGHNRYISSVAFSRDGQYLATGSYDKTCKIWNAENRFEIITTIEAHTSWIHSVAFSADCKYLVTGSRDNTCKIWDVKNGFKLVNTIEGHNNPISSVTFSTQGKYLATGSCDNTCKIWNVENKFELTNTIEGHTDNISSVAFSADGKYLATGSDDKTCKIWNVEGGFKHIKTIEGHTELIFSASFSANGKYLATGSRDKTCKIWDIEKGFELIATIQGHTNDILSVAFSADSKYLATASGDQTCRIWNIENGFGLLSEEFDYKNYIKQIDQVKSLPLLLYQV